MIVSPGQHGMSPSFAFQIFLVAGWTIRTILMRLIEAAVSVMPARRGDNQPRQAPYVGLVLHRRRAFGFLDVAVGRRCSRAGRGTKIVSPFADALAFFEISRPRRLFFGSRKIDSHDIRILPGGLIRQDRSARTRECRKWTEWTASPAG